MKKKALNRPFAGLRKQLARRQREAAQHRVATKPHVTAEEPPGSSKATEESFASLAAATAPRTIQPLAPAHTRVRPAPPAAALRVPQSPAAVCEEYDLFTRDGGYIEGRRCDVDPAELESLRHAQPHSVVDLHGLAAEQARRQLHRALLGRYHRGDGELLVVVGKGLHSQGGRAVLREGIALWLSEARIAPYVRAFVTARREHGGSGSLYVRIRP